MFDDSRTLVARVRAATDAGNSTETAAGDAAAEEIFRRYIHRLTALARARLAREVGRRVDPEDAVQSAFRSFFVGARSGKFSLVESGDLWRLLATITKRKAGRLNVHHRARKRNVRRDLTADDSQAFAGAERIAARLPTPAEAAALADDLAQLMQSLTPELRKTLELRLQDHSAEEIAVRLNCSPRTVRRRLEQLRKILERRAESDTAPNSMPQKSFSPGELSCQLRPSAKVAEGRMSVTAPDIPSCGPQVSLDYRDLVIQSHLGSGGMGRVYRAWQRSTGATVALKVLRKALIKQPAAVERFRREARIVAGLEHPGIVRTHGFGRMPGGSEFFTMDLVAGGDLSAVERATLTAEQIARWIREAAEAVSYANDRGIVHCDLKPGNLLLDAEGRVVVGDFGLAAAIRAEAAPLGATPAFAAPELLCPQLGPVSAATDVWGLGAALAWLLWGRAPWRETNVAELLARIERGAGPELPEVETSPQRGVLIAVCRRAMAIDPRERYMSCSEVAAALASLQPPTCRPSSGPHCVST